MNITLTQMLGLVGKLDDSPNEDSARSRFRKTLQENIIEVGPVRDYIEECLRNTGIQYNRALQDLVNFVGQFLGFDITYGRYQGVPGEIGFDGHWTSPTGSHIVVEVKTTDVYSVKTLTLVGYVDQLISAGRIPDWDHALGLYILGKPDPEMKQLENAIIAEKRTGQLRIISVESLLSLAELMTQFDVNHADIMYVLSPSGPRIDALVDLTSRLVAQKAVPEVLTPVAEAQKKETAPDEKTLLASAQVKYWLTPVKSTDAETAQECIKKLVGHEKIYAFGDKTPGRKSLTSGDWICFYASGTGIIAHAKVLASPQRKPHKAILQPDAYPWTFQLSDVELYLDHPVVVNATLRSELDAFKGKEPNAPWSWFVQATHTLTENDFKSLTRKKFS